jgi:phospholipase C
MHTRREFLKIAALASGAAGLANLLPDAIERARAIEPDPDRSYLDAEHVVILMQENRSFDHSFGSLRGVRGFNDPRAIQLANGNPVWLQTNDAGQSYVPFRLNIKDTNATWMGSLPHSWTNQVDAKNQGRYDRWLQSKRSGHAQFADIPLTLGYYVRDDIPFYYALADAFTICDQHFCSSLTGTTPNRLHLWTGTIREHQSPDSPANVLNEDVDYGAEASWPTFPERLEDHGISWKVYQNELSVPTGFEGQEETWLANFGDNPLEFFSQYGVHYSANHRGYLEALAKSLPSEIAVLQKQADESDNSATFQKQLQEKTALLNQVQKARSQWNEENFGKLSTRAKALHAKAFSINDADLHYRQLDRLTYRDGEVERELQVPKGDVLYQFRRDVADGKLPNVSWLVPPEAFSDHPSSAWFGAWYIAEVLDILTQTPAIWKKTIFILTYDENDGYFDHLPPFGAPNPSRPETGLVSQGLDTALEFVDMQQELKRKPPEQARENSIGLGYRVPLIIASPWSRGGCVCSQVFDHTSPLQFLERLLSHKTGREIKEPNINQWRRAVCGDLTATFQSNSEPNYSTPPFPDRDAFVEEIHKAKFKGLPTGYSALTEEDIQQIRRDPHASPHLPRQEPGVRRSAALPYQLVVDGQLDNGRGRFAIQLEARNEVFGSRSAGAPFIVYAHTRPDDFKTRDYAVEPGARLDDSWPLSDFENGSYRLAVHGPNGFFREFRANSSDPELEIRLEYGRNAAVDPALSGSVEIYAANRSGSQPYTIEVLDESYRGAAQSRSLSPGESATLVADTRSSFGWYDLGVRVLEHDQFKKRYAGRVETGHWTYSDPVMGRVVG